MKTFDYVVIGSGIAGLTFALKAAEKGSVAIVTKRSKSESNTAWAQGGIACVSSDEDSIELHVRDTLIAGDGLCNEEVVRTILTEGPQLVQELMQLEIQFDQRTNDQGGRELDLAREGGHSKRRILHVADTTGREIEKALLAAITAHSNITLFENHMAVDLITTEKLKKTDSNLQKKVEEIPQEARGLLVEIAKGVQEQGVTTRRPAVYRDMLEEASTSATALFASAVDLCKKPIQCLGLYVLDEDHDKIETLRAHVTVLATGGCGKVYRYTTNPSIATGDGVAMAWRAGADIANMEFMQFHPTCLFHSKATSFLISEAVRGEGALLLNGAHERFMSRYDARLELAPRDIVARAIDAEMKKRGDPCVYLDISHQPATFLQSRFPAIYETCLRCGIDITKEPIPVVPAAHYQCGGVKTDLSGATSLVGLYAIGEAACTGLHGANRLASNSLLEALVMAHRAARHAAGQEISASFFQELPEWCSGEAQDPDELVVIYHNWDEIRQLMWDYMGIVRTNKRLQRAATRLKNLEAEIQEFYWNFKISVDLLELRNLVTTASLMVHSAMNRKESRGLHFTLDYPQHEEAFLQDTILKKGEVKRYEG